MALLLICEKPQASLKIATALADNKPIKKTIKNVSYYELTHDKKKIYVVAAVGHLFTLTEREKKGWIYPVFDIIWKPIYEVSKSAIFTKPYVEIIKKLAKESNEFCVSTDKDLEGELIGYNILRFLCDKKDAKRMEFSTLTKEDLLNSYDHMKPHIDFPLAEAGETRHELDYFYGISISRALTLSIKHATNMFKIMSSGRVQGPALYILYKKEKEIQAFKPEPYWEISLQGNLDNKKIEAFHKKCPFKDKKDADSILEKTKNKKAFISQISKREFKQEPLLPFDLTSLQIEAYRTLGLSPRVTLELAQMLYTNSYISYPRTSSQKLPAAINYKRIVEKLKSSYPKEADYLLKKKILKPTEGKKTDPAHPAIYPTGEIPEKLEGKTHGLYELITRRFFVCFGDPAVRETVSYEINCNNELFGINGTTTKESGWHKLYGRFANFKEEELPKANEKDEIKNVKIITYDKETQPPKRYTEASLIKELEKKNIGTKSTRAEIISTLYDRDYIKEKNIEVTYLGIKTSETLEKYCPELLDENLTRQFEEEMEGITQGKFKKDQVIEDAKKTLIKIFDHFRKNEINIGKDLADAVKITRTEESTLGLCPGCKQGDLMIKRSKYGLFAACSKYPECKTTMSLPSGLIKPTGKICPECSYPIVMVIRKAKRPQEICLNPKCPSKQVQDDKIKKEIESINSGKVKKQCPKCGADLVVRTGFYGTFLACSKYPNCKYTENIQTK